MLELSVRNIFCWYLRALRRLGGMCVRCRDAGISLLTRVFIMFIKLEFIESIVML